MTSFATLTLLVTTLLAPFVTPIPTPVDPATLASRAVSKTYYLRTSVHPNQHHNARRFNDLYLESYHTGAGLGDATFSPNKTITGYLNGTEQVLNVGSGFEWSMVLASQTFYTAWQPVEINAGGDDEGSGGSFFINGIGLQFTPGPEAESGFAGWKVCDWWHEVPQLFWKTTDFETQVQTAGCADVDLVPEYV